MNYFRSLGNSKHVFLSSHKNSKRNNFLAKNTPNFDFFGIFPPLVCGGKIPSTARFSGIKSWHILSFRWSPYSRRARMSWSWDLTNVGPTKSLTALVPETYGCAMNLSQLKIIRSSYFGPMPFLQCWGLPGYLPWWAIVGPNAASYSRCHQSAVSVEVFELKIPHKEWIHEKVCIYILYVCNM